MLHVDDIIAKVQSYNSQADRALIKKAYAFSEKAHAGQLRKSGQPFVVHPLEVGYVLAEMKLDAASIAAGILHDTIEDTKATKKEISQLFGEEISELVDGVTKLSKLSFSSQEIRQAESFRKMIVAMSRDIRVILIKLADRLSNLRTLQFMPEEKQLSISQETLDIYAPLANRLGIEWMKVQLEDLSFRFLKPEIYKQIEKKIARLKKNQDDYIKKVKEALTKHYQNHIAHFDISGRMKHIYGTYKKMERQNITFEQVHDLLAFRIFTNTLEECYEALGLLHSIWKPVPGRFKDYVAMPKGNNYQSLHSTVICLDGVRVEFQIRTYEMHEIAEQGIAAHWKYKEDGRLDLKSEKTFLWLRQLVEWQKELKDSLEFMDTVKGDLFTTDIYVFTPKGDVRALPFGATPLDFAYSIHSDVGLHCSAARVNGRLVPLHHKLKSGDEVEIVTADKSSPTKDWLDVAVSSRAKARIRQYLKIAQKDRSISLGKNIFEEECAKYHIMPADLSGKTEFEDYLKKKGTVFGDSFYSALAYGKISMPALISSVAPNQMEVKSQQEEGIIRKIFKKVSRKSKDMVLISGLDDILVSFAKCCAPVKGDPIIGFVTRGRGVTLHRVVCPKVMAIDTERRVNAAWNEDAAVIRTAKLFISCENKTGMLAEIAKKISEKKVNISKAIIRTTRDEKALILLDVGVLHVTELHSVIKAVEKVKGVISVERQIG